MPRHTYLRPDIVQSFEDQYGCSAGATRDCVELEACGTCAGVNGYTTLSQARRLAAAAGLAPGLRVLDVGAGSGFPGVWLASEYGCAVELVDVPLAGARAAMKRAANAEVRAGFTLASATHLPFEPARFDAVVHTDVVCCVRQKFVMLRECRRVLRPGGRMAYFTIYVPPGLGSRERAEAREAGPAAVWSRSTQEQLLRSAGFLRIRETDLTRGYLRTARAWFRANARHAAEMEEVIGVEQFEQRQRERRANIVAIEKGLLRRGLFVAEAPASRVR